VNLSGSATGLGVRLEPRGGNDPAKQHDLAARHKGLTKLKVAFDSPGTRECRGPGLKRDFESPGIGARDLLRCESQ